jgi:hypothetical protein
MNQRPHQLHAEAAQQLGIQLPSGVDGKPIM